MVVVIPFSLLFLFLSIETNYRCPIDLMLLPWVIWLGVKAVETFQIYKIQMDYIYKRYRDKLL